MPAFLNHTGRIWRFTANSSDDSVGGAVPTGTILYSPVFSSIIAEPPTMAILEQGIETTEIFTAHLSYTAFSPTGTFDVQHNDIYEVTFPPVSSYYQKKFRIIGVRHQPFNDQRRYLTVTLRRMETANPNNLQ